MIYQILKIFKRIASFYPEMILRPLFCFEDTKNTGLLIFNSLKLKKLIFNFFVNRNRKKLTDSRKRAKILADFRPSIKRQPLWLLTLSEFFKRNAPLIKSKHEEMFLTKQWFLLYLAYYCLYHPPHRHHLLSWIVINAFQFHEKSARTNGFFFH